MKVSRNARNALLFPCPNERWSEMTEKRKRMEKSCSFRCYKAIRAITGSNKDGFI